MIKNMDKVKERLAAYTNTFRICRLKVIQCKIKRKDDCVGALCPEFQRCELVKDIREELNEELLKINFKYL